MARTAKDKIVPFTINNVVVQEGQLIAYTLGKRTQGVGVYVKTAGVANIIVTDLGGRNKGEQMYVHKSKVTGFATQENNITT